MLIYYPTFVHVEAAEASILLFATRTSPLGRVVAIVQE